MFVLGRALVRETRKHCTYTLLARIAPASYFAFQDQLGKDIENHTVSFRAMVTNTRKSSRNTAANAGPSAMDIEAGIQARFHSAFSWMFYS